jgi:aminopeptidase N
MNRLNSFIVKSLVIAYVLAISIVRLDAEIPVSSPVNYIPQAFDVIEYKAKFDLTKAPLTEMTAECNIRIVWVDVPDTNYFYFHLEGLNIDTILYNGSGTIVHFTQSSGGRSYCSVEPIDSKVGDTAVIKVKYHGDMKSADSFGGVFSNNGILYSVGVGFSNESVSSTRYWLACYDHPSDKANIEFTFITESDQIVASNGLKIRDTIDQGLRTTIWRTFYPVATNLMTFSVHPYKTIEFPGADIPVVIYTRASDSAASASVYRKVSDMVNSMEIRYGPYPFEKVGYVNTPLSGGAMEHQTMVTMSENEIRQLYKQKDSVNETAAHELSHQWFGNLVTPYDYRDAWFNEGFATFAAAVWLEDLYDYKRYLYKLGIYASTYIDYYSKQETVFPLYDFLRISPSSNYPVTIYYKGCLVAAMLRYELGDEIFFAALRSFFKVYKNGNMITEMLKNEFEKISDKELDWFFDQWVYGMGFPILDISISKSKSDEFGKYKAEITIEQTQKSEWGTYRNLPLEFNFYDKSGNRFDTVLIVDSRHNVFNLDNLLDFSNSVENNGSIVKSLVRIDKRVLSVDGDDNCLSEINVYPNPASEKLIISNSCNIQITELSLTNLYGTELQRISPDDLNINGVQTINLNDLPNGIYYLGIFQGESIRYSSFIINR